MNLIPVIILSGFLGSGKTTLLVRLIADTKRMRLRPGILMNELGKQDVDGYILHDAAPDLSMEKLFDGCICCDKKSEVISSLQQLIIELTGVANPEEIADSLTEPLLKDRTKLLHIITVLDAEHVLDYNSIFSTDRALVHTLRRQLEVAGIILVNKSDLVTESKLNKTDSVSVSIDTVTPGSPTPAPSVIASTEQTAPSLKAADSNKLPTSTVSDPLDTLFPHDEYSEDLAKLGKKLYKKDFISIGEKGGYQRLCL